MTMNLAIEEIAASLSTQFGAEDAAENKVFQDAIRSVCAEKLNKLNLVPKGSLAPPKPVTTAVAAVAAPTQSRRNGYNLFVSDLRASLLNECGSEEAAKAEFNKRGGITGAWVKDEWAKQTEAQKTDWNAKAKLEREGTAPAPTAIGGGANKRATSSWQLFQKAFSNELKAKKEAGEEVAVFKDIGERSKACSEAYKLVKDKPKELAEYIAKHK